MESGINPSQAEALQPDACRRAVDGGQEKSIRVTGAAGPVAAGLWHTLSLSPHLLHPCDLPLCPDRSRIRKLDADRTHPNGAFNQPLHTFCFKTRVFMFQTILSFAMPIKKDQ